SVATRVQSRRRPIRYTCESTEHHGPGRGSCSEGCMNSTTAALATDESELVLALRAGDEDAFTNLVNRYQSAMLQVALTYVRSRAIAEEVVQEAWLGVLNGIGRFEGRSQLKTWIIRIVINRAKRRGSEEARTTPFSGLQPAS